MLKKIIQSRVATIGIVIVLFFLLIGVFNYDHSISLLKRERLNTQNKIAEAKQKREKLAQEQEYFKSEAYLERKARIKLNYKKADEEAVLVYKTQTPNPDTDKRPENNPKSAGILSKIISWFKNIF